MFYETDTISFTETNVYVISYLLIGAITNTKLIMMTSFIVMYKGLRICFITTEYKLSQLLFQRIKFIMIPKFTFLKGIQPVLQLFLGRNLTIKNVSVMKL